MAECTPAADRLLTEKGCRSRWHGLAPATAYRTELHCTYNACTCSNWVPWLPHAGRLVGVPTLTHLLCPSQLATRNCARSACNEFSTFLIPEDCACLQLCARKPATLLRAPRLLLIVTSTPLRFGTDLARVKYLTRRHQPRFHGRGRCACRNTQPVSPSIFDRTPKTRAGGYLGVLDGDFLAAAPDPRL